MYTDWRPRTFNKAEILSHSTYKKPLRKVKVNAICIELKIGVQKNTSDAKLI